MAPESVGEPSSACWEWDVTASIVPEIVSEDWTNGAAQAGKHACCVLIFSISARIQNSVQLEKSFFAYLSTGHGPRSSLATASVQLFMQKMYYSISESMPTGLLGQHQSLSRQLPFILCASQLANGKAMPVVCQLAGVCVPASWQTDMSCQWSASLLAATLESVCQPAGKQKSHFSGLPACWQPLLRLANRKGTSVACQLAGSHS